MFKLTKCNHCKTKFKHDKNQQRKFCSQSCSTIMKNKLSTKPKKVKIVKGRKKEWSIYWDMYNFGLVGLQDIKNLMREKYVNLRAEIINSQKNGN